MKNIYLCRGQVVTASSKKNAVTKVLATSEEVLNDVNIRMNREYTYLYNHHDKVPGYDEAVHAFDAFAKKNKRFIGEFIRHRGDFISSDREAAAFMFALEDLDMLGNNDSLRIVANWSKKDLDKLGMSEREFKRFSDKLKRKTFKVS